MIGLLGDWIVGWLVGWLARRSVAWLLGWLEGRPVAGVWLCAGLVGWLLELLVGWLVGWSVGCLVAWLQELGRMAPADSLSRRAHLACQSHLVDCQLLVWRCLLSRGGLSTLAAAGLVVGRWLVGWFDVLGCRPLVGRLVIGRSWVGWSLGSLCWSLVLVLNWFVIGLSRVACDHQQPETSWQKYTATSTKKSNSPSNSPSK